MASASRLVLAVTALLWLFVLRLSNAADTLTAGKLMKDWEFLDSQNTIFQLGFFNPFYSSNRYLGIRYMAYDELKLVWVANRENPLNNTSGYLNITQDGYLVIGDERGTSIRLNSGKPATGSNTSVTLLDSGNLVLKAGQRVVWQSFDHPTDTILPGMKFGLFDLKLRQPRKLFLTSWVSPGDPAAGAFTLGVDANNAKQLEVLQRGVPYWRSGNWNGKKFSYFPNDRDYGESLKFSYVSNENESYFTYTLAKHSYSWIELNSTGDIYLCVADDHFLRVGIEIACDMGSEYNSKGCIEKQPSKCRGGTEFVLIFATMDSWEYSNNYSLGLSDCQQICANNCSCKAYGSASADGSGCRFSYGKIFDDRPVRWLQSFYIRNTTAPNHSRIAINEEKNRTVAHGGPSVSLPLNKEPPTKKKKRLIVVGVSVSFAVACSLCYLIWTKCFSKGKRGSSQMHVGRETEQFISELGSSIAAMDEGTAGSSMPKGVKDHKLPLFSFSSIETATGHFSEANKLGQGGFGPVYKGKLVDGQEIAVKRLSERSGQGIEEFKNEVVLISKVQHRNLTRLFGCCIKGVEKILIYEYLPNKSLDTFLFDETKRQLLDWKMRVNIIEGIAQGLLYLHKYSILKIIHRDLKTSNILLDNNMNPKISDFGTAKIFGENESRANTSRIVGTYGYMSPEYAMDGLFSVKSDVFSFGVMMLEIISGKKNTGFYQSNHSLNLVRYAWNLWKEERSLELMDQTLAETCSTNEFVRFVQVALLCVQENAEDRPTMSEVVSMLGSDLGILPEPKQSSVSTLPRVYGDELPDKTGYSSINDVTISSIQAR